MVVIHFHWWSVIQTAWPLRLCLFIEIISQTHADHAMPTILSKFAEIYFTNASKFVKLKTVKLKTGEI